MFGVTTRPEALCKCDYGHAQGPKGAVAVVARREARTIFGSDARATTRVGPATPPTYTTSWPHEAVCERAHRWWRVDQGCRATQPQPGHRARRVGRSGLFSLALALRQQITLFAVAWPPDSVQTHMRFLLRQQFDAGKQLADVTGVSNVWESPR